MQGEKEREHCKQFELGMYILIKAYMKLNVLK